MSVNKRIIPVILVFAIVIFSVVPVQAAGDLVPVSDDSGSGGNVTYVSPVVLNLNEILFRTGDKVEGMSRWLRSKIQEDYCPEAENYRHSFKIQHTQVGGETGDYYICEYCGKSAGEVAQEVYNNYVEDLPAPGISSNGSYYYPGYIDTGLGWWCKSEYYVDQADTYLGHIISPDWDRTFYKSVDGPAICVYGYDDTSSGHSIPTLISTVPVNAQKTVSRTSVSYNHEYIVDGVTWYINTGYGLLTSELTYSDSPFPVFNWADSGYSGWSVASLSAVLAQAGVFFPVSQSEPIDTVNDTTYNINTRAGTLVGDYGIMGDNGQITKVDSNTSIVNETDNSVYNPVTNTTTNYDSFDYDYTTRAYTFTKNDGDTVTTSTVTYGDEYMTIEEGDTVYNVYYIYQNENEDQPSPSPAPALAVHSHSYTGTITKEPTCTIPGQKTMTCSCGDSYVQSVPALGHDWVVKTTVPTVYDEETGELVTDGYTIYQCTRCGEEYRDDDGTGPPGLVDTTASPAAGSWQEFRQRLLDFFSAVPDMFGDLSEFMRESWSYIPSEAAWFLSFGVAMVVVLALWKFWWR